MPSNVETNFFHVRTHLAMHFPLVDDTCLYSWYDLFKRGMMADQNVFKMKLAVNSLRSRLFALKHEKNKPLGELNSTFQCSLCVMFLVYRQLLHNMCF